MNEAEEVLIQTKPIEIRVLRSLRENLRKIEENMQILKEFRESEISNENRSKSHILSEKKDTLKVQQRLNESQMEMENNGTEGKLNSIETYSFVEPSCSDVFSNERKSNEKSKVVSNEIKLNIKPYILQNQVLIEELMGLGGRRVLKDFLLLLSRVDAWERGYKEVIGDRLVGGRRVEEDQLDSEEKKVTYLIQEYRKLSKT